MNPLAYLLMPVVLSVVGSVLMALWMARTPRTVESDVDAFRRKMEILAQGSRLASQASPMPAVVKAEQPRQVRIRIGDD